jgi:hypothetical protein
VKSGARLRKPATIQESASSRIWDSSWVGVLRMESNVLLLRSFQTSYNTSSTRESNPRLKVSGTLERACCHHSTRKESALRQSCCWEPTCGRRRCQTSLVNTQEVNRWSVDSA